MYTKFITSCCVIYIPIYTTLYIFIYNDIAELLPSQFNRFQLIIFKMQNDSETYNTPETIFIESTLYIWTRINFTQLKYDLNFNAFFPIAFLNSKNKNESITEITLIPNKNPSSKINFRKKKQKVVEKFNESLFGAEILFFLRMEQ